MLKFCLREREEKSRSSPVGVRWHSGSTAVCNIPSPTAVKRAWSAFVHIVFSQQKHIVFITLVTKEEKPLEKMFLWCREVTILPFLTDLMFTCKGYYLFVLSYSPLAHTPSMLLRSPSAISPFAIFDTPQWCSLFLELLRRLSYSNIDFPPPLRGLGGVINNQQHHEQTQASGPSARILHYCRSQIVHFLICRAFSCLKVAAGRPWGVSIPSGGFISTGVGALSLYRFWRCHTVFGIYGVTSLQEINQLNIKKEGLDITWGGGGLFFTKANFYFVLFYFLMCWNSDMAEFQQKLLPQLEEVKAKRFGGWLKQAKFKLSMISGHWGGVK